MVLTPWFKASRLRLDIGLAAVVVLLAGSVAWGQDGLEWYRPVDQNVFTTAHGNNHDTIFFVEPGSAYKYHLIVSHETSGADYWRTNNFSWSSDTWTLVSDDYDIGGQYEYDDGVKVGDTYYIYEAGQDDPNGIVYTYTGDLADANGQWQQTGSFPKAQADDIGVWYEDGLFHIYGEYGSFSGGFDGASLSHLTSPTGLGDWTLQRTDAVVPGAGYGVGDATIAKIDGEYWLYCDREGNGETYRITAWKADSLYDQFEFVDVAIAPRESETDDYDNHRIQDGDIGYVSKLGQWVMFANVRDIDGDPGPGSTRFAGVFYAKEANTDPGVIYESAAPITVPAGEAVAVTGLGNLNNDDLGENRTLIVEFDVELTSVSGTDVTWFALGVGFDGEPGSGAEASDVVGSNSGEESDAALMLRTLDPDDPETKDHRIWINGDANDDEINFGDVIADGVVGSVRITMDLSAAGIAAGELADLLAEIDEDGDGIYDVSASGTFAWTDADNYVWLGSRNGSSHTVSNLRIVATPEPASLVLLVLGGAGGLLRRRRR
jgi:hypothetical protein